MAKKEFNVNKYDNYKTYDGQAIPEGMVLAPFWIDKEFKNNNETCIPENFTTWKICRFPFLIGFTPIKKEIFSDYMTWFWSNINNELEPKRAGRCIIARKENGEPIICPKCNRCTYCEKKGTLERYKPRLETLSLDFCYDNDSFEFEDVSIPNPEDVIVEKELFKSLLEYLRKIKPRYADIIQYYSYGLTPEEIIQRINLKPSRGYQEINTARKLTLEYLHI